MKVSIITATYNSGKTLRDTINSVLDQSYENIEYLVIDGLSKDNTIDIIREYEPLFKGRMKWISEKDNGLYDAFNKGIRMATGDVVGVLNSDDFFTSSQVISQIVEGFDAKSDAIYGDIHFVAPDNLKKSVRYYSSKIFRPQLMRYGIMPAHPSFYCRKECFEKYGFYKTDYKIGADFDLLLRFLFVNHLSAKYLSLDVVTMRTGGVSTDGWRAKQQNTKDMVRALKENGVRSNAFMVSMRYFIKIAGIIMAH